MVILARMACIWQVFVCFECLVLLNPPLERDAMGSDEYHPISHSGSNISSNGGIGYTVVDALDTMYIMGLQDDYTRARKWVKDKLSFDREGTFSTFEVSLSSSLVLANIRPRRQFEY